MPRLCGVFDNHKYKPCLLRLHHTSFLGCFLLADRLPSLSFYHICSQVCVEVVATMGGLSALRRRTCFLWATPLTLTGFITSSTTQPHSLRNTAPPYYTTHHTTQHKSPWLSSVSTRNSLTSVGTWTSSSLLRRRALPFTRTTVHERGALEHSDSATGLRYDPGTSG